MNDAHYLDHGFDHRITDPESITHYFEKSYSNHERQTLQYWHDFQEHSSKKHFSDSNVHFPKPYLDKPQESGFVSWLLQQKTVPGHQYGDHQKYEEHQRWHDLNDRFSYKHFDDPDVHLPKPYLDDSEGHESPKNWPALLQKTDPRLYRDISERIFHHFADEITRQVASDEDISKGNSFKEDASQKRVSLHDWPSFHHRCEFFEKKLP